MAVTEGSTIQITPDSLNTSYAKYRKDLILMPTRALDEVAKYMSRRLGVRGKETVGEANGDMQIGPYSLTREDEDGVTITGRTLETYLGSGVKHLSLMRFVSQSMALTFSKAMLSKPAYHQAHWSLPLCQGG